MHAVAHLEPTECHMSDNLVLASEAEPPRWMSFVVVNDRVPRANQQCARCGGKIEKGYIRRSQTGLVYCDTQCFPGLTKNPLAAFVSRTRNVS